MRVKPSRDQNKVGPKRIGCRDQDPFEGLAVFLVALTRQHRNVDRQPLRLSLPLFGTGARPGITRVLMRTEKEDRGIIIERVLRPVAMVDIPIHDQHTAEPMAALEVSGGNRDIIEQAEPHRMVPLGVMARRTDRAEGIVHSVRHNRVRRGQDPAGGQIRRLQ